MESNLCADPAFLVVNTLFILVWSLSLCSSVSPVVIVLLIRAFDFEDVIAHVAFRHTSVVDDHLSWRTWGRDSNDPLGVSPNFDRLRRVAAIERHRYRD